MSRSLIFTVNPSVQEVADGGTVALGGIVRRYGCNLTLSGDTIVANGPGYYEVTCTVIAAPTEVGTITATLYGNGVELPGAKATFTVSEANQIVTLPLQTVIREACACLGPVSISCVLSGVDASVSNIATRVVKE